MLPSSMDSEGYQANGTLDMLCWFADVLLERRYGSYLTTE